MEQHKDIAQEAGLRIVAVGLGEPKHARRYCGKLAPGATCYVDKSTRAYEAFGFKQGGARQLLNPRLITATARAMKGGHTQGKSTGDVKMLGGTFIIDQQGIIQRAHYSEFAGDNPDLVSFIDQAAHILHAENPVAL